MEQITRAFMAQAVADAFCYPYEFSKPTLDQVRKDYLDNHQIAISDDTQMALFGLYALGKFKRNAGAAIHSHSGDLTSILREAYLAWYRTQSDLTPSHANWLEAVPEMRRSRAPGHTCLASLARWAVGGIVRNDSKGNGAVMRTLPFLFIPDLLPGLTWEEAHQIALRAGQLTHHHRESDHAVMHYMRLGALLNYSKRPADVLADFSVSPYTLNYQTAAAVHAKHNTFTAMPAFVAAVVALRNAFACPPSQRFYSLMLEIATSGGDADTIAAIAGGLYGLQHEPPAELVTRLRENAIIRRVVTWASGRGEEENVQPPVQTGGMGARPEG